MDGAFTTEAIGRILTLLLSFLLLQPGLLYWQLSEIRRSQRIEQRRFGQSFGCSCLGQFAAFVLTLLLLGNGFNALCGALFAILCSICSYIVLRFVVKLPHPTALQSAIWIATVSLPAQTYAFGWVVPG
ncbi:MAG: hypothetical protein R3F46_08755 [bacterium]